MSKKRYTTLKNKISEYLHIIGWIILIISVLALGQYIANQVDLLLFEESIFSKILTEDKR